MACDTGVPDLVTDKEPRGGCLRAVFPDALLPDDANRLAVVSFGSWPAWMHSQPASLIASFHITPHVRTIALVGGGGKTSLMYALARELVRNGRRVITTTTTKIFVPSPEESPCLQLVDNDPELSQLPDLVAEHRHVTVAQSIVAATGKLAGVSQEILDICMRSAEHVLVEADGAAGRPIKAPEGWEPVIPRFTDLIIPVVGLDCLGKPASDAAVFRLPLFLAVTGLREGARIDPEAVAAVIMHAQGIMKGAPETARPIPFLNKLDALLHPACAADEVANILFHKHSAIRRVVIGQLKPQIVVRALDSCAAEPAENGSN